MCIILGQGTFGTVKLEQGGVAVKRFSKLDGPNIVESGREEARILAKLSHECVVNFYEVLENNREVAIHMQYVPGKTLQRLIDEQKLFSEKAARTILGSILSAAQHFHSMGVCHMDLKPDNVVVGLTKATVIDFGLAIDLNNVDSDFRSYCRGTLEYTAPEVLSSGFCSTKADVWSIGVILYQMVVGTLPFKGNSHWEIRDQIVRTECDIQIPSWLSDSCKNLLSAMLTRDPEQRITAEEALESPWFENEDFVNCYSPRRILEKLSTSNLLSLPKVVTQPSPRRLDTILEEDEEEF